MHEGGGAPHPHYFFPVGDCYSQSKGQCRAPTLMFVARLWKLSVYSDEWAEFYFPVFFLLPFGAVPKSSFTILTAHRSPHIEQVSVFPSRSWIFRA